MTVKKVNNGVKTLGKPSRSTLAVELKKFKKDRDDALLSEWQKQRDEYINEYTTTKIKVLTELGILELQERYELVTGGNIIRDSNSLASLWLSGDSKASILIKQHLDEIGVNRPADRSSMHGRKNSHEVDVDYENARQHIMFDDPMTVVSAFEIIEAFKTGKHITEFVPPMVRLLGGYPSQKEP